MAQSPEYPDLKWMEPRAWGAGRDGKAVRYIVIHYTAGSERSTSAEDGAVNDQHRTDGTSTHYFVDRDSIIQCVRTRDRANAARHKGNRLGIQYELCGTAQTRAQWFDAASLPTLRNAARQVARDCRKYGIPVRRLTVAETRHAWTAFPDGPKGIVGHVDCTRAYPEDGGDHTDPGAQFPWDDFLDMVRAELNPEDDMPLTTADVNDIKAAILGDGGIQQLLSRVEALASGRDPYSSGEQNVLHQRLAALTKQVATLGASLSTAINALAPAVAAQVIANLPAGADQISQEEVTTAVKTALRDAFSG